MIALAQRVIEFGGIAIALNMPQEPGGKQYPDDSEGPWRRILWVTGIWVFPLWWAALYLFPASSLTTGLVSAAAMALAPFPVILYARVRRRRLTVQLANAEERAAQLKLQLDGVRYRTARLREDLSAADRQARLSHQLTLLGQFTAGFLHEFNNPLAIVSGRIEILLEERSGDAALCTDLQQMLKETRYMGKIAGTLLRALRRERGAEVFEPSVPAHALEEAQAALKSSAESQGVRFVRETADAPRVNLPEHVLWEVTRGLIANAIQALKGREDGVVWLRIEPYRSPGAKVVLRVEDNGPGVPEAIRDHLFEPFVTQATGRERLGLGLFLAASLLDMYDACLRYESRDGGGASFVIEMPPARFTRGQPYQWFGGGVAT